MHPQKIYYLFQFLTSLGMTCIVTSYTPFLLSIGLSLSEVALINVGFWGIIIFSEIPTGIFADTKSRAWSLQVGTAFHAFGEMVYLTAHTFLTAFFAELIVGVGAAFLSGVQQAWITDALGKRNESYQLRRVFATGSAWRGMGALLGGVLGGVATAWFGLRAGWVLNAFFMMCALVLAIMKMNGHGEPEVRVTEREAFRGSFETLRRTPALQWATATAVAFGLVVPFNHYWSPFFVERVGQVNLVWVWIVLYGAVTCAGFAARRIKDNVGAEVHWLCGALLCAGVGFAFLGMTVGALVPIGMVIVHEFGRGAFEPLLDSFTQHRVPSSFRATYGSLQSLIGRIGFAGTLIAVWIGTRGLPNTVETMTVVLLIFGLLLAAAALWLWFFRPRD